MSKVILTMDEAIGTIKRSSLINIAIEGKDDVIVYRRLEEIFQENISLLAMGGREQVLELFSRKSEFEGSPVIYIVDKDLWVFDDIPEEYRNKKIITTNGYSIENDAYSDINPEKYLQDYEKSSFQGELEKFNKWYALTIKRINQGIHCSLSWHPNHILDSDYQDFIKLNDGEDFPEDLFEKINSEYKKILRGKSLMGLIIRQFSKKGRTPSYHHHYFLEAAAVERKENIENIYQKVYEAIHA